MSDDLRRALQAMLRLFDNQGSMVADFNTLQTAVNDGYTALAKPDAPSRPDALLPKRPFAFAVQRAPETGQNQRRLFMDEGEARKEAEQLDGDYEALFKVGDRRSAIASLGVRSQVDSAVRVWLECPADKRPSTAALGIRVAEIVSGKDSGIIVPAPADLSEISEALTSAHEYFDNRADVNDGDYGVPSPNREMTLAALCSDAIASLGALNRSLIPTRPTAGGDMREALDSLLAFRHGDTKHLTSEHARILYAALAKPDASNASVEARLRDETCGKCHGSGFVGEPCVKNECTECEGQGSYEVAFSPAGGDEAKTSEGGQTSVLNGSLSVVQQVENINHIVGVVQGHVVEKNPVVLDNVSVTVNHSPTHIGLDDVIGHDDALGAGDSQPSADRPVKALEPSDPTTAPAAVEAIKDLDRYIVDIVKNAMLTMWNDICADTDCHPLDIEHGQGKYLTFTPKHWAEACGKMVRANILSLLNASDAGRAR